MINLSFLGISFVTVVFLEGMLYLRTEDRGAIGTTFSKDLGVSLFVAEGKWLFE